MKYFFALIFFASLLGQAEATDRYISPGGGGSSCTSGTPCSWATALAATGPGDSIILKNGTYPPLNISGLNGTSGAPITITAENERQAKILGTGASVVHLYNSSYVVIERLLIQNVDNISETTTDKDTYFAQNSHHLTVRRNLLIQPNRYWNAHMLLFLDVTDSLIEDNEVYYFHRHGIIIQNPYTTIGGGNNIVRRNYCNARNAQALPNAGGNFGGGVCVSLYPTNNTIVENNITEAVSSWTATGAGFMELNAAATFTNNRMFGNISLLGGIVLDPRGPPNDIYYMPRNNHFEHQVSINVPDTFGAGLAIEPSKDTQCNNCSFIGNTYGILLRPSGAGWIGDGAGTASFTNTLFLNNSNGFTHTDPVTATWSVTNSRFFGNTTASSPGLTDSHITGETTTDPGMGSCYLWAPDGSNLNTANIGARVLYRYTNGVLQTSVGDRLWNPSSGAWLWGGAVISGVNDIAGSSLANVHQRLHVGAANGCAFPASYAPSGPVVAVTITAPSSADTATVTTATITLSGTASGLGFK